MTVVEALEREDPAEVGEYRLRGRIGAGGQGTVYLAEGPEGRVALKLLHVRTGADSAARRRFDHEVRAAQRVDPSCTARIIAADFDLGRPFLVSEYVEGPSLQEAVKRDGPRSGAALLELAIGTATALAAIHRAGIVHRDFKPSNVLLGPDGPRVIDFGVARLLDATASVTTGVVGTPAYLAPEQLADAPLSPALDVFAWGSTVAYTAGGRPPFGDTSIPAIIGRILHGEPDLSALDGPLRTVVASTLVKDPADRPTAEEVVASLRTIESGHALLAAPRPRRVPAVTVPGGARRSGPWLSRRLIGAGAVVAVLVAGGAVWWNGTGGEERDVPPQPSSTARYRPDGPPLRAVPGPLTGSTATLADPGGRLALTTYDNYLLDPATGRFEIGEPDPVVGPDGWHYALNNLESLLLTIKDRRAGTTNTVKLPRVPVGMSWSPDGRRILLTAAGDHSYENTGFMIVDVATKKTRFVPVKGPRLPGVFWWNADGTGVVTNSGPAYSYDIRFYRLDGRLVRTLKGRYHGLLTGPVSPSGRFLVGECDRAQNARPAERDSSCVWDARTGALRMKVRGGFAGWYDQDTPAFRGAETVFARTVTGRTIATLLSNAGITMRYGFSVYPR